MWSQALLQRLELAFRKIQFQNKKDPESEYRIPALYRIEGVAHELAHAICLGDQAMCTRSIGHVIRAMPDQQANQHELQTLRVEYTGLLRLGLRVNLKRLIYTAAWRPDGRRVVVLRSGKADQIERSWLPKPEAVHARLTVFERRCVADFVAIVRKEL
jgi:hypothetical protein